MRKDALHYTFPNDLPKWQDLGLPDVYKIIKLHRGLVLCTGLRDQGNQQP